MQYIKGAWETLINALHGNSESVYGARTYYITEKRYVYIGYALDDSIPKCIRKSKKDCMMTLHWIDSDGKLRVENRREMLGVELMDGIKSHIPIDTPCFSVRIEWCGKHYHFIYSYLEKSPT